MPHLQLFFAAITASMMLSAPVPVICPPPSFCTEPDCPPGGAHPCRPCCQEVLSDLSSHNLLSSARSSLHVLWLTLSTPNCTIPYPICTKQCMARCECPKGTVINELTNTCVPVNSYPTAASLLPGSCPLDKPRVDCLVDPCKSASCSASPGAMDLWITVVAAMQDSSRERTKSQGVVEVYTSHLHSNKL